MAFLLVIFLLIGIFTAFYAACGPRYAVPDRALSFAASTICFCMVALVSLTFAV